MTDTAVKLWIRDIISGKYTPNESGYGGSVATSDGTIISKVRVLGTVVDKFVSDTGSFASATIDDSTETINVKLFKDRISEIEDLKIGDILDILGDINEYQGEVYVLPRAMTKVDINWEMLRRVELNAKSSASAPAVQTEKVEELVFKKLEELDKGSGVELESLIKV